MSARNKIQDLINKKASRISEIRARTSRNHNYRHIVMEFFKAMDLHYFEAKDANDLKMRFKKEERLMYSRLRAIHPSAGVNPIWNTESEDVEWTELRVQSVVVRFPPDVATKLGLPEQESIDVGDILLDFLDL